MKYKGYVGSLEISIEDNCLFGKVLGLSKACITYEGNTVVELQDDFHKSVDSYLAQCNEHNIEPEKSFCGSLNIRIPANIHEKLAIEARHKNTTINNLIKTALTEYVDTLLA